MLAILFNIDLLSSEYNKGYLPAYKEIKETLDGYGFKPQNNWLYTSQNENLKNLYDAIEALKSLTWFSIAVTEFTVFRMELFSDLIDHVKTKNKNTSVP